MSQTALRLIDRIVDLGLNGAGPIAGAKALADEYRAKYSTPEAAAMAMVRWESKKSFAVGAVTSAGGVITLPVTLPANLVATWANQVRLVGAIAQNPFSTVIAPA